MPTTRNCPWCGPKPEGEPCDKPGCGGFPVSVDSVNHPDHYTTGDIECIDAMKAQASREEFEGHLRLCAVKYLWRWRHKGGVESLKKARWYLDRLISEVE